ncbi:MMPL family transporter [Sphaerotilus microaerophilus]|uniref:Membrane protein n=1 Tax=Sphaerotilus microaerophilus TaxID=2914710 RepID=A0ABM7YSD4_9BURK|nr:MMPL family transporter [Sphaerotilus sp. FB-5]BDI07474.1 membrane protein [Sphaerotilus sp. FB-5]
MTTGNGAALQRGRLQRLAAPLLWLLLLAAALGVALRARYVADLSAFLPAAPTAEQRVLLEQLRSGATARLLFIGVTGPEAATPVAGGVSAAPSAGSPEAAALRVRLSRELGAVLRAGGRFEAVHNGDSAATEAIGRYLFEQRYRFSPAVDAQRFSEAGLRAAIDDTVALLGTPAGSLIKPLLWRDPTGEAVQMAQAMTPATAPAEQDGLWVSRNGQRAVLLAFTRADGADLDGQAAAADEVRSQFAKLVAAVPAAQRPRLELSGPGLMGVQSRALIQDEVERLAQLGTALMVGLLLLSFGSLRALAVAMLPVATGVLAGIAAVALLFGEVHGFTLGFGTTLIGEAVDYAIYYLIQAGGAAGAAVGAAHWLRSSWPTVRLGLWTSLAGFAALAISGFGGLAQLGVFSMAGLLAAAGTTRWVLVRLAPAGATGQGMRPAMGRFMALALHSWPRTRWLWLGLTAAALLLTAWQPSAWRGSLSSMSMLSPAALALDESLRADLGAADGGVLVAVEGPDEATVLERAEAAGRRLDALVEAGQLMGYESPARWLPSPATQRARLAALPPAEELSARLAAATADGPLPASKLQPFLDDVQAQRGQPLLDRQALQATPLAPVLNAQLLPGGRDARSGTTRPWTVLMPLHLKPDAADAAATDLQRALQGLPETRLVRISKELNALYAHYLREAQWQTLAGAGLVVLLLAWHLRSARRLWRVLAPLAASVALVHAGLALAGVALGILHLVGFLLVVAVGSNYALFFDHLQSDPGAPAGGPDRDTLTSLLLANLTTVLSFGLLAISGMPALAAIGQVVAPGALLSLWLAAAFAAPRSAAGEGAQRA